MSRSLPASDCYDLAFRGAYPLGEPEEVALEDYARVLVRARACEGLRRPDDPSLVHGVHVCGLGSVLTQAVVTDIEDFARGLMGAERGGLGWS